MIKNILVILLVFISYQNMVAYDITVALDGSGDFTTIQEAVLSVRDYTPVPKSIFVKDGLYREKLVIPANKSYITIVGESKENTIITWDDHANINKMGTFNTHTVRINGNYITIKNLTIENNAPQIGQAVALHIEGNRVAVIDCRLLGFQDTLFTGNEFSWHYFKDCFIDGTTDFIFGPATAWFENCTIHSKRNSYITAASTSINQEIGYVFNKCTLTADDDVTKVYLGRPWRAYAYVLFMNCELGKHIRSEGWENWRNPENEKTARYAESNNTGEGAKTEGRVNWCKQLNENETKAITLEKVFPGWEIPQ